MMAERDGYENKKLSRESRMEMRRVNNCSYLQLMAFDRTTLRLLLETILSVLKHSNETFIDFQR
jgi:tRNA threonylcarbamoyladenosine modification (KEOPS) complex  Pcc1 subunit